VRPAALVAPGGDTGFLVAHFAHSLTLVRLPP